jgi:hypothetical protein
MIKDIIKKIPIIGGIAKTVYRYCKEIPTFSGSAKYWEDRYQGGGNSGAGSYNNLAEFKAEVINEFVKENNIETVIEFGCGDGNQLKYFEFKSYIGFDVSNTAISICKKLYKSDSSKQFKLLELFNGEKAELTLSLDVIFHLVEDEVYLDHMKKLFSSSEKYVIVYSSNYNEPENNRIAQHVKHRKFTDWIEENAPDFKLLKFIPNKYQFDGDGLRTSFSDFYIFSKLN